MPSQRPSPVFITNGGTSVMPTRRGCLVLGRLGGEGQSEQGKAEQDPFWHGVGRSLATALSFGRG